MMRRPVQSFCVVGGGTAGWMAAALLAELCPQGTSITLVESEEIGTIGVGEATIPMIRRLNDVLRIDEADFMKSVNGTFKLGIEFVGWGGTNSRYIHGFGRIGQDAFTLPFFQYWLAGQRKGIAGSLERYSITRMAALAGKFAHPRPDLHDSPLRDINYAYHFDATLYAKLLRNVAEANGVRRINGLVKHVELNSLDGRIAAVHLDNGQSISADFFFDCSGFRSILLGGALKTPYIDWSHWLKCDSAVAVPSERSGPIQPFTRSTAHEAGWQWRIPLQHRTGNGHVYCSTYVTDERAKDQLLSSLDGRPLADPRVIRFKTGKRAQVWEKNCLGLGLSSGFMEPLESTSIHLVQSVFSRFLQFFPYAEPDQVEIDEFNRQVHQEFEQIRDFLILHYAINTRGERFWRDCASMLLPERLQEKIAIFERCGRVVRDGLELFSEEAWIQVFEGQGVTPKAASALVNNLSDSQLDEFLTSVRETVARCVAVMPACEVALKGRYAASMD